uniref:Protein Smaug n=1 Tax=Culex pipiens TaxID=7175 RepID=A0A8D8P8V5_CULPI
MKFPGGNPLLFCEQVSTVTSFFEQWNDCERTVVLYALLKRVPFANLKFLQLSIDYNLAQNYSTQSKLQLLESHANNANFLNQLVQRYQTSGDVPATNGLTSCSDSGFQESSKEKKSSSTFDLSGGSSASSTTSSSSTSSTASDPAAKSTAGVDNKSGAESATVAPPGHQESKKDILNDMLVYLPLLKPGNDDVKSVYMSLIPAAVEDACQRAVPTELVQHILSYLLIHPAVNNDDRRYGRRSTGVTVWLAGFFCVFAVLFIFVFLCRWLLSCVLFLVDFACSFICAHLEMFNTSFHVICC